jgi:hypothetical protein
MLRPLTESGEKVHGEKVQKAFDNSFESVLGFSELSWPVLDDDFTDFPATGSSEHRNEAMQFAVQSHFAKHLTPIAFESAIVVMQANTRQEPDEPIKGTRGDDFVPRVVAHLLPAANHVEAIL